MYIDPLPQAEGGGQNVSIGMFYFCYSNTYYIEKSPCYFVLQCLRTSVSPKGRGGCTLVGRNTIVKEKEYSINVHSTLYSMYDVD
jgi:hypothetical protein